MCLVEGLLIVNGFVLDVRLLDMVDVKLCKLGDVINRWIIVSNGLEGYCKVEVILGGVDMRELL